MKTLNTVVNLFVKLALMAFLLILISCNNDSGSIVGNWEIQGVGSSDSTFVDENLLGLTVMNMVANGAEFEFNSKGEFRMGTDPNDYEGNYMISLDSKSITLKDDNTEQIFELNKISKNNIQLKSTSEGVVINLVRK
jgi:hypothetical protein